MSGSDHVNRSEDFGASIARRLLCKRGNVDRNLEEIYR
jgi:hypothetical protein